MAKTNTTTTTSTALPTLPALPRMSRMARPKTADCECGCGGKTGTRFVPGHDSRLRGWMLRIERGLVGTTPATFPGRPGELKAALEHLRAEKRTIPGEAAKRESKPRTKPAKTEAAQATAAEEAPAQE